MLFENTDQHHYFIFLFMWLDSFGN